MPLHFGKVAMLLLALLIASKMADGIPVPNPDAEPFIMTLFPFFIGETEVAYNNNHTIPFAAGIAAGKTLNEYRKMLFYPFAALAGVDYT